jgi:integrase
MARGHGEGSIYRRKDANGREVGPYLASISTIGADGRTARVQLASSRTKEEARSRIREAQDKLAAGLTLEGDKLTVAVFLARWIEAAAPKLRPNTVSGYRACINRYIVPEVGGIAVAKLSPLMVDEMLRALAARGPAPRPGQPVRPVRGLAPRTVGQVRAILRRALGQAVKWGMVARNVAALSDPPRVEAFEVKPFSPQEAGAFLAFIAGDPQGIDPGPSVNAEAPAPRRADRNEALFITALATGCRQGELLGLTWADLDLPAGVLHVRHQLQVVDGRPELVEPKTAKSRRSLRVPASVVETLTQHRQRQRFEARAAGDAWQGEWNLVFCSTIGTPLDGSNVLHSFQRALAAAGLRKMRFHDLRHSAATFLLLAGVPDRVVMAQLGHSQISTTALYSHVVDSMLADAAGLMDGMLLKVRADAARPTDGMLLEVSAAQ